MTSRRRLLAALLRQPVDRVPVTLYEFHDFGGCWAATEPSYRPLLDLQRTLGDTFVSAPCGSGLLGDQRTMKSITEPLGDGQLETFLEVPTPLGRLTCRYRRNPLTATTWTIKHWIEDDEDLRRYLSIEPWYEPPDTAALRDLVRRTAEDGVLNFSLGDPLGHAAGLFRFEHFVLRCLEDLGVVLAVLDRIAEHLRRAIDFINGLMSEACVRFWGPEYCGAPLMDARRFFPRLVVDYVRPLVDRVHRGGNIAIVHCHGRLDAILEMIADTGADVLEPLEVLPVSTADVTLEQVKRRVGSRMCLAGGMQALDLDTGTPDLIRLRVRRLLAEGGREGLVILPTSTPLAVPLPGRVLENYRALFVEASAASA